MDNHLLVTGVRCTMQGVDKEYDDAEGRVKDKEADLAEYLDQIREQLGAGKDLCYVTVNKDVNLLEIPQVNLVAFADALPTLQNDLLGAQRWTNRHIKCLHQIRPFRTVHTVYDCCVSCM